MSDFQKLNQNHSNDARLIQKPEIIAEIGSNHYTRTAVAERLIAAIAASGADTCKTQIIFADEILHARSAPFRIDDRLVDVYQRFKALQQPLSFYRTIKAICDAHSLRFLVSVFGEKSLRYALALGCKRIKIASPEINHLPLLRACAAHGCTLILSCGVSHVADIERALSIVDRKRCALLHCVSTYPTPVTEYNVRTIDSLRALFGVPVGISDHTRHPLSVPLASLLTDAAIIEKHVILTPDSAALDHAVSITVSELRQMCAAINDLVGVDKQRAYHMLEKQIGVRQLATILGDGIKRLAPSEAQRYATTNRSIRASSDITRGDILSSKNCAILRGESLGGGLHPQYWEVVLGAVAQNDIKAGRGICFEDIIARPH